eukprot:6184778-Pleurochrysis_carterae.AAC.4
MQMLLTCKGICSPSAAGGLPESQFNEFALKALPASKRISTFTNTAIERVMSRTCGSRAGNRHW